MSMEMDWKFNDDGSMERITFHGLNGNEFVGNLKSSLELLRIASPAKAAALPRISWNRQQGHSIYFFIFHLPTTQKAKRQD